MKLLGYFCQFPVRLIFLLLLPLPSRFLYQTKTNFISLVCQPCRDFPYARILSFSLNSCLLSWHDMEIHLCCQSIWRKVVDKLQNKQWGYHSWPHLRRKSWLAVNQSVDGSPENGSHMGRPFIWWLTTANAPKRPNTFQIGEMRCSFRNNLNIKTQTCAKTHAEEETSCDHIDQADKTYSWPTLAII